VHRVALCHGWRGLVEAFHAAACPAHFPLAHVRPKRDGGAARAEVAAQVVGSHL
jgi:hypothetical protein